MTKVSPLLALAGLLLPGTAGAYAAGRDLGAGWRVEWDEPQGMIDVHIEKIGVGFLTLSIDAVFVRAGDEYSSRTLRFVQTGDDRVTAPRLIIDHELLENRTGQHWSGFEWLLASAQGAWFNAARSQSFDTNPFRQRYFDEPAPLDGAGPTRLRSFDGELDPGALFRPGRDAGDLFMDVDLGSAEPVSFTLRQVPLPEPSAALLLLACAAGLRRPGR